MQELINQVESIGNYNSISTSVSSNNSVVNLVEGLTLTKEADKTNWVNGNLTYTITLKNDTEISYENPVITDKLDTTLVNFVDGSVKINGTTATSSEYNYDSSTGTLTVNLASVGESSSSVVTFEVTKKS